MRRITPLLMWAISGELQDRSEDEARVRSLKPMWARGVDHLIDDLVALAEGVVEGNGHAVLEAGGAHGVFERGADLPRMLGRHIQKIGAVPGETFEFFQMLDGGLIVEP